jgi:hypothetical protein
MTRCDVTYPEDAPSMVRMRTSHCPHETMTPDAARKLAAELVEVAEECDGANMAKRRA